MLLKHYTSTTFLGNKEPEKVNEIENSYVSDLKSFSLGEVSGTKIIPITNSRSGIPYLTQPYYTDILEEAVIVDMRYFISKQSKQDDFTVTNRREFNSNLIKAILYAKWLKEDYTFFKVNLVDCGIYFNKVIGSKLKQHFNLDPAKSFELQVTLAIYWAGMVDEDFYDRDDYTMYVATRRYINHSNETFTRVKSKINKMKNVNELVMSLKNVADSVKTRNLDTSVFLTMVSSVTFGFQIKTDIAIAMEFPPYWCSMVFSALSDKSFKRTYIVGQARKDNGVIVREITKLTKDLIKE